jgi:hypothetical protein
MLYRQVFSGNDTGNKNRVRMTRQAHEHHSALNWEGEGIYLTSVSSQHFGITSHKSFQFFELYISMPTLAV